MLLCSKLFLLSLAHINTITRGGDKNMQGIECYALKIFMIEKTPTPRSTLVPPVSLTKGGGPYVELYLIYAFPFV